jgi:hypothetical protein
MNTQIAITRRNVLRGVPTLALLGAFAQGTPAQSQSVSAAEARAIAKEAYIYGFPLVDSYRIQYAYFVDRGNPEYKGSWNTIVSVARVFTPHDKEIQTPNSDTPYSMVGADLRSEPLVFTVPTMEDGRYYSLQFVDMYTFNFAYVGTRATGNGAGRFLLAGPRWNEQTPNGVKSVIRSETELALIIYRTQLFDPGDIENVKRIQASYKVEPLSQFLGRPAPAASPSINFVKPLTVEQQRTSPEFFNLLNFVLQFCPTQPSEEELMARFARLNIGASKNFDASALPPELVQDGMADAWKAYNEFKTTQLDAGKVTSGDLFGTAIPKPRPRIRSTPSTLLVGSSTESTATCCTSRPVSFRPPMRSGRSRCTSCHQVCFTPIRSTVT